MKHTLLHIVRRVFVNGLITVLLFCAATPLRAQKVTYTWNPQHMLVFGAGGGLTKYFGEFMDQNYGGMGQAHVKYFILPELGFQINGGLGNYVYNRRLRDQFKFAYARQFYRDPRLVGLTEFPEGDFSEVADNPLMRNPVLEVDKLWFAEARVIVNLFPERWVNAYISTGVGMLRYENSNANRMLADGRSVLNVGFGAEPFWVDTQSGEIASGISNIPADANTLPIIPVGLGLDIMITEQVAFNADVTYRFLIGDGADMMDGFGEIVQENFNAAGRVDRTKSTENADSWGSFSLGFEIYLFGHKDKDGDGLSDTHEESIGTDPLNPDTDGDGLTDDEEIELYGTDPLKTDTDDDRLTDAEEVAKQTDPRKADTDEDGLTEGEEFAHGTDPFDKDSDKDGLSDGEEVHRWRSDPLRTDSDADGLPDPDEVRIHKSDPRSRDTDADGLEDGRELELGTDPSHADSDADGLSDGDEILKHQTDPLKSDSDGDGKTDGEEIGSGSNPFDRDSDGDGISDGEDLCPSEKETINGYRDDDGCPDGEPLTREPLTVGQTIVLEGVEFEEGSATLTAIARNTLRAAVQTLRDNPTARVEIGGHTDDRGSASSNQELSQLRAESVKLFIVSEGIDVSRLEVRGYGEEMPRSSNGSARGRARNRRIEFKVLSLN
ncbi:MAG: hypothetical protein C0600_12735 [Ignavibacteria bacterium]|nr:MAG: hypothetical protein C0600_12735 [Ignavibacteria bacterium]